MNPDHVIIHVDTNDLSNDTKADKITNSIDVVRTFKSNKCGISSILPRNDKWNRQVIDANEDLEDM